MSRLTISDRMHKTYDSIIPYWGYYWSTSGKCRIRIYEGAAGDAPVVICSQLPGNTSITDIAEYLAAEVMEKFLPDLPDLPVPMLWVEYYPSERLRRDAETFDLVTFASYEPRRTPTSRLGPLRVALGPPERLRSSRSEVESLVGQRVSR